ncbi:TPA: YSIRK-type signal peptide-containing protein, partial [Streptococcus suis]
MRKAKKKSFDWYGTRQHFSIRKYHFGAASVLLGMSLALGAGAQVAQAETSAASSETTTAVASTTDTSASSEAVVEEATVASSTETAVSASETATSTSSSSEASTTETVASTATATSTERSAAINYTVQYVLEDGTVVKADVKLATVSTTEATAKTSVTVATELPAGYELASGQTATVTQEVTEGAANVVNVKVVKKAEATTTTATTELKATATASSETTTSTETKAATTEAVAETVKTPATVEEAKVVLEQVTSEAEVLANEAERLVAASDSDNTALKSAAAATKLAATEATAVLNNSAATLEAVNAQIDTVRTNVEALVLELRKFLGTDVIQVALTTTTASATVTQSTGNWTENAAVLNKEVAEQEATITPTDEDINSEYKLTEVADYKTFFVVDLSGNQDPTDTSIKNQGSFNYRFDKNWYMRFSTNSTLNDGSVLAELVDRSANHNVVETLTISPGESKQFNNIKTLAASSPIRENKDFQYKITNSEYNFSKDGQTSTLRNLDVYAGIGGTALSTIIYSSESTTIQGSVQNSFSSPIPTSGLDVTTKYVLEKTALKEEKLLATYTLSDANSGDTYTIAGAADFENYELVKTPQSNTGVVGPTYVKGSYVISASWAASHNVVMVQTFSKDDGTSKFLNFALNVDHEDVKEYYKKTDVTAEDLKLEETIAIINDTLLSNEEKLTQIKALNAPFLLMFVSDDIAPRAGNTGPDLLTGKEVWTYTSNRLWIRNAYGAPYGDGKYGPVSHEITNTLFEQNGYPKGMFLPYEYILVNESGQYIDFDGNVHTGSNKTSFGGKRMFMFNEFSPSTGDVTYYYAEKGGVKVYYINEDGVEIATANLVIDHETSGTTFNVKSAEKSEITAADGTVYLFKAIDTNIKKATDPEERFTEKITSYEGAIKVDTVQELTLVYVKQQVGTVKFVDTTDNTVKFTENLSGKTGDEFGFDPAAKIKEFENLGYTVVNRDGYSSTGTFDNIDGNSQDFTYELTPKVSPITPDKPGVPGQPIDPNNPDGPTWPTDKGVDDVTRTISRTVTYVKAEGGEAAPGSSNSVTFERSGEINHVTGEVTWQAWTAKDGDATLEGNPLPLVSGYIAKTATNNGTAVAVSTTVDDITATETTGDITEVVTYVKLGSWIPQPPTGTVEVPPTVYPNDPTDPTQPGTDVPTIPYIPGYIPVGPDETTPLEPVDPDDPTKGYKAPPVPGDPTTNTKIPYVKAAQTGSVKFVDTTDGSVKFTETLNGQTGDEFGYDPAAKIKEFENLGYTVVNKDSYSSTGTFDNIDGNSQDFVYELTPKVSPITPENPGKPGEPIDPNTPDGPKWPTDKGVDDVTRTISRTVTYVKAEGGEAAPGSSNSVTFERSGEINHVTGEVTWQAWTAKDGDATLEGNPLPVVTGYMAQSATNNGTGVAPSTTADAIEATETTGDITEVVTYVKLGSWIPQPPTGTVEVPPTVYPNDPTDPTQPGTDVPTIPYIPGYIPVGPDGTTPLEPVDPDDPTKGYKAPPVPGDPTTDTKIPYVKASQTGSVKFVDTTDGSVKFTETLNGQTGDEFGYDPAAKIKEFENLGYTVVNKDSYSSTGTFDNIDG